MLQLEHELKQLCREHRHDGHTTQRDRLAMSKTIARDLDKSGFHKFCRQKKCARRLKDKHVRALVEHWRGGGLSPGTINNRLAFLRHVFEWTGKAGVMHKSNAAYHDGKRVRYATVSKAAYVQPGASERVGNQLAKASMRLQITFGLRRKEALMIQPAKADQGTYIALDGPWCKGNRPRIIPIDSPEQRAALDFAKSVARGGSLIPPSMTYKAYQDGQWAPCLRGGWCDRDTRFSARLGAGPVRGHDRNALSGARRPAASSDDLRADTQGPVGTRRHLERTWARPQEGDELVSGQAKRRPEREGIGLWPGKCSDLSLSPFSRPILFENADIS